MPRAEFRSRSPAPHSRPEAGCFTAIARRWGVAIGDSSGGAGPFARRSRGVFPMARQSRDLFDDSTMTFGEHLEALRTHLFKAIIGLVLASGVCLYYGDSIVAFVRKPIDRALQQYSADKRNERIEVQDDAQLTKEEWYSGLAKMWDEFWTTISGSDVAEPPKTKDGQPEPEPLQQASVRVAITAFELLTAIHEVRPEIPAPDANDAALKEKLVHLTLTAPEFAQFRVMANQSLEPVTFRVEEAFMSYLKVSLIASVLVASPWIFYQLWLFVAAGLYQHERKFVYIYGTMSLVLFIAGAAFCFFAVFPFVLKFLLAFNRNIGVTPQIRLSEWISFAVVLPLMFGISFQLPLVMKFLTAISVFNVGLYRTKRRLAILAIAFISMVLTPADPFSMLLMMIPLLFLYELGILLCQFSSRSNPFEGEPA
jgi:sec-independent protein translocase protein TatC